MKLLLELAMISLILRQSTSGLVPVEVFSISTTWFSGKAPALMLRRMITPPLACTTNWSSPVDAVTVSVESLQTKDPSWLAMAPRPAAKL